MLNNINQIEQHDYSDNLFIGRVVENDDPLQLRRIKVLIPNLFDSDNPDELPWVAPKYMGFIANLPGVAGSKNLIPSIGAQVIVELQQGSPLHGLYIGSFERPDTILAEFQENYLGKYGWKDPAGNLFIVDTTEGQVTIRVLHGPSQTELKIVNNGDTSLTVPQGAATVTVHGNVTVHSDGHVNVTAQQINLN